MTIGPIFALPAQKVAVQDLIIHPESFSQDQTVEIECYFNRESSAWLHLIQDSSKYTGFFVYAAKSKSFISKKESYPYVFAPVALRNKLRNLRKGDLILLSGKCFKHKAVGKEDVGIIVDEIKIPGEEESAEGVEETKSQAWSGAFNPPKRPRSENSSVNVAGADSAAAISGTGKGTYAIQMGSNTLSGLHWGEKYTLNGVEFIVKEDNQ